MSPINVTAMVATVKAIGAAAKAAGRIDLYQQVLELQQNVMEAIAENTRLTSENAELSRRVIELERQLDEAKDALAARSEMFFRDGMYWRKDSSDADESFCPKCLDADEKAVHMVDLHNGFHSCPNCKYTCRNKNYRAPDPYPPPSTSFSPFRRF